METMPDFWRTEVFHPLSVHFPIALLLFATVAKTIACFSNRETFHYGGSLLLYLGVVGIWIAIYTGNLADGAVGRTLCDPTILKTHENWGYNCAWIFTAAMGLDLLLRYGYRYTAHFQKLLKRFSLLLMFVGTAALFYVGHLGATLTYQQAAGVYIPTNDCREFE
ncbi:MAG: hypothetical protein CMC08_04080 [Flavobacteriaceae bacterium]|nr:hypothetical protein [Flavobacteriaceae bacterium]